MRIPASRFTTLPEGCPVLNSRGGEATILAYDGTNRRGVDMYMLDFPGVGRFTYAVDEIRVALSTPAAIRAFAPELIAAVKGRTRFTTPQRQPSAVWHAGFRRWILVDYLTSNDTVVAYEPTTGVSIGTTPAECLLNGLQAALDAAGGAS